MATAVGQAILFLFAPIITRLYTPSDFGVLATFSAFVLILSVPATLRLEMALLVAPTDEEADDLLWTALSWALIFSLFAGALLWGLTTTNLQTKEPLKSIHPYLFLLVLGILLYASAQMLTYRLIRKQEYLPQSLSRWVQPLLHSLTQIIGGILHLGVIGLLIGQLVGNLSSVAIQARGSVFRRVSVSQSGRLLRKYFQFPLYNVPTAFLNILGIQTPIILSISFYSSIEAGLLGLAFRVVATPIELLGTSLSQIYLGRASEYVRQTPQLLSRFIWHAIKKLALFGIFPVGILALFAPYLFATVFGSEWRQSGEFLRILAPMLFLQMLVVPISRTLILIRRFTLHFIWEIFRLVLVVLSFWIPAKLALTFQIALIGYTVVYSMSLVVLMALILWSVREK